MTGNQEFTPNRAESPSRAPAPEIEPEETLEGAEPSASPRYPIHPLTKAADRAAARARMEPSLDDVPSPDELVDALIDETKADDAVYTNGDLAVLTIEGVEDHLPEVPRGVVVAHAWDAAERWLGYLLHGAVRVSGRMGPSAMVRTSAPKGLEVAHQVALFVEGTPLYEHAKTLLWAAARLQPEELRRPTVPRLRLFLLELQLRLPEEFFPPRRPLAGIEVEAMLRREDELRQAEIDERYRQRYPGMVRPGFDAGWRKGGKKRG